MDPQTKLLTDMLTRGVLSMEQFAAEMARYWVLGTSDQH